MALGDDEFADAAWQVDGTVMCDPSFLSTRTGRVWIERAVRDGYARLVSAPQSYFSGPSELPQAFGLYAFRSRSDVWGAEVPDVVLIDGEPVADEVGRRLLERDQRSLIQVWFALRSGALLVCRRPRTLDLLVAAGVKTRVELGDEARVRDALPSGVSFDLGGALARRTRFLCRAVKGDDHGFWLEVLDLGPWGPGGVRSSFTSLW